MPDVNKNFGNDQIIQEEYQRIALSIQKKMDLIRQELAIKNAQIFDLTKEIDGLDEKIRKTGEVLNNLDNGEVQGDLNESLTLHKNIEELGNKRYRLMNKKLALQNSLMDVYNSLVVESKRMNEILHNLNERYRYLVRKNYELSLRDHLTRMYTRRLLEEELYKKIDQFAHEQRLAKTDGEHRLGEKFLKDLSILFFDLDYFKKINDSYGHQAGDEALKMITDIIHRNVRESDIEIRYGGEELILVMPGADESVAYQKAEIIRREIENTPLIFANKKITLTTSIGVSYVDLSHIRWTDGISTEVESKERERFNNLIDEGIQKSDFATYQAKAQGRNVVVVFEDLPSEDKERAFGQWIMEKESGKLPSSPSLDRDEIIQ